jgi:hypothetical protein
MYELGNATLGQGHSERVGGQLASQRVAHGPARRLAAGKVDFPDLGGQR